MVFSSFLRQLRSHMLMAVVFFTVFGLGCTAATASTLRWAPTGTADVSRSINIYADRIANWTQDNDIILLMKGHVWIKQGTNGLRMDKAIIWINSEGKGTKKIYKLRVYGEGQVQADARGKSTVSEQALVEMQTSGEVTAKPSKDGSIQQAAFPRDPVYQRGLNAFYLLKSDLPASPQVDAITTEMYSLPHVGTPEPLALPPNRNPRPPSTSGPVLAATSALPPSAQEVKHATLQMPTGVRGGPIRQVQAQQPKAGTPGGGLISVPRIGGGAANPFGPRSVTIRPRSTLQKPKVKNYGLPTGETAIVVSSGIILMVTNADGKGGVLDIEADSLVFWTKGSPRQIIEDLKGSRGKQDRSLEFYLAGNVEIRTQSGGESQLLRANEIYYDVNRNVAVALDADLEIIDGKLINPLHLEADQLLQLGANKFKAIRAKLNASALPADPGLSIRVDDAKIERRQIIRYTIFGQPIIDRNTGQPVKDTQRYFTGQNVVVQLEDVPVFYLPFIQGDADDPLGPLENISVGYNRILGAQLYTTWDMYDLIGITEVPGTKWRLELDGLTDRGPAIGTDYSFVGTSLLGIPNRYSGFVKARGMYDGGMDVLGGNRGAIIQTSTNPPEFNTVGTPEWRGRFLGLMNVQELPYGFVVQSQMNFISDRNFLEQYYLGDWLNSINQDTYLYAKQQQGNWAWTGLVQPRTRRWITTTEWLPRFDGYVLGMKFFDWVTYNAWASVGYAELEPTDEPAFEFEPTSQDTNTFRGDLWQEASIPFQLGALKLAPYGVIDLTYYSNTLDGESRGRFYGGGGTRVSMPLSRLYDGVQSELFNLDGLYHKVMLHGNYFNAYSDTDHELLPQLDRLNDDASNQALRDITPVQSIFNPSNAAFLTMSQLFDPQAYAIRQLVDNRIDTKDDIEVVELGIRQRWQTKRGFPGRRHIIDWMTLDLSMSVFPRADRDNFGEHVAFLKYDWSWNIGDRTSLVSTGWVDPIENGPRVFTLGTYLNRPDNTNFYLGYRQIDPLESKAVIGSLSYIFSDKYSMTASALYDFGVENQVTSLVLTRSGKDLRVSLGVTYNSILNNWGLVFEILPNLTRNRIRSPGLSGPFTSSGIRQ